MLHFPVEPDPVFDAILVTALETQIDEFREDLELESPPYTEWRESYAIANVFTLPMALETLEALLAAYHDPKLYQPTDYHWVLLYDALYAFCELHNDAVAGEGPQPVGPYVIGPIEFDNMTEDYFWDTDFLVGDVLLDMPEQGRRMMRYSPEAFGIAAGLTPHPDELRLVEREPDPDWGWQHGYPASGTIPTYPAEGEDSEEDDDAEE